MEPRVIRSPAPDTYLELVDSTASLEPIGYEAAWPVPAYEQDRQEPATDATNAG